MYPLLINLILRSLPRSQPTPCHRSTLPLLCVTRVFHFLYLYYKDSLFNVPKDNDKFSVVYLALSFFTLFIYLFFFIKEDALFRRMKSVEFIYMYIYNFFEPPQRAQRSRTKARFIRNIVYSYFLY